MSAHFTSVPFGEGSASSRGCVGARTDIGPACGENLPAPEAFGAPSAYYRHNVFDHGLTADRYCFSSGGHTSPSGISVVRGRVPIDAATFHSAPNAIRRQWWSDPSGYWEASIHPQLWRNRGSAFDGDALISWVHAPRALDATQLPRLRLRDGGADLPSCTGATVSYAAARRG